MSIPSAKPLSDRDIQDDALIRQCLVSVLMALAEGRLRAPGPTLGMTAAHFAAMLEHCGTDPDKAFDLSGVAPAPPEFDELVMLFLEHRAHDGPEIEWLARAIACGCSGDNHLYQDMGLPNRQVLSDLLRIHFTALFDKNTGDMKWKKFFYKQLCERAEVKACRAPSCQVCSDYWNCFGPEEPAVIPFHSSPLE